MSMPVITTTPVMVSCFTTMEYTRGKLKDAYPEMGTGKRNALAGIAAGSVMSNIFVTPELLKARAQMTKNGRVNYTKEIKLIISQNGYRGLFRGFWALYFQTTIGCAAYFPTYELLKEASMFESGTLAALLWKLNAAGIAGILRWGGTLPLDIIKSK